MYIKIILALYVFVVKSRVFVVKLRVYIFFRNYRSVFYSRIGRASKLGAPSLAYSEEDNIFLDEDMGNLTRAHNYTTMEKNRLGRAGTRSSPPRIYRRTISSASTSRQQDVDSTKNAAMITSMPASYATTTSTSDAAATQKTRARQPIKRRTQRSHTDQLFAQNAPIAKTEFEGFDDEEMESYAAQSDSLVQALALSNSSKAKATGDMVGAGGLEATKLRGSKTLLRAKGLSKEKGLDKKKSRSRTTSCSQQ